MGVAFIPVNSASDQEKLARLAGQIWREYWPEHIGEGQTEYMVERFQSLEAIRRDMSENGYEYWFIVADDEEMDDDQAARAQWGRIVGFTGGHDEPGSNRFFISKIYLLAEARGHHHASRTIGFYSALCHARGFRAMYLTVNKHNELAIRAYKGTGFVTIDAVETDIGGGFVMDDYIMEKQVGGSGGTRVVRGSVPRPIAVGKSDHMHIVVLNGSPRRAGNTSRLAKAFADGAEEAGHTVDVVPVASIRVGGCLGCECCQADGADGCVQDDDMRKVYDRLRDADMVVLASPVYHFALSGQLQCVINRTYALGRLEHVRKSALILSAGGGERMFVPAVEQYRSLVWWWRAEDLGVFTVSGVHRNHDLENTPREALDELRAFGRSL